MHQNWDLKAEARFSGNMSKPYKEQINNGIKYREFDPMVESDELVWHRDRQTRIVTVLEGEGWMFQMDNEIPKEMKPGDILEMKKMEYHRLYKSGTTPLKISIKEKYMKTFKEYTSDKEVNKMINDIAKKAKVTIKLRDNVVSLKSNGDLDTFLVAVKNFNKTSDVPMIAHQIWRAGEGRIKVPAVKLTYNQKIPASMFATYKGNKEFNEAKRMKYDKVIKKLKDGEWDTSMDVKQRMHLTYTDNNTGKKKVVFVESLQEADLEEAAAKVIRIPNGASMQVARHNKRAGYWEPANNKTMRVTSGGNYEVVDVEDRYNSGRFYIFLANNKHYMINASAISVVEDTQYEESADLEEANGDWVIYNKKTGKRLSPSTSWRKWQGAKAAASKIGGDAEVADAAWYQDNKDKLMGEATDLEEATFYKPKTHTY